MITREWFLTAAHCVVDPDPSLYSAVIGATNLTAGSVDGGARRRVAQVVVHPDYSPGGSSGFIRNDIAMMKLDTPHDCVDVRVADASDDALTTSGNLRIMGWGRTSTQGSLVDNLQSVLVVPWKDRECKAAYGPQVDISNQRCAVAPNGNGACIGDEGSPLLNQRNGPVFAIVGMSQQFVCGNASRPGVYARLSAYAPWMASVAGTRINTPAILWKSPKQTREIFFASDLPTNSITRSGASQSREVVMQIDPELSPAAFSSLAPGMSWYLVVRTCGTLLETTLDTLILLQNPNPYRHGIAADVLAFDDTCTGVGSPTAARKATIAYMELTGPDHAPFAILEFRGRYTGSGKVTLSWTVTRNPTGYYGTVVTERGNPAA